MILDNLIPITGTIQTIRLRANSCDEFILSLDVAGEPVNIILTQGTDVVDSIQMYQGMCIVAFYDGTSPVPLIYPPQYRAVVIAVLQQDESAALKYFDATLMAEDQSLRLNINPSTDITTHNGQVYTCNPGDNYLLVFYSVTTRSIPPQASPNRIIIF